MSNKYMEAIKRLKIKKNLVPVHTTRGGRSVMSGTDIKEYKMTQAENYVRATSKHPDPNVKVRANQNLEQVSKDVPNQAATRESRIEKAKTLVGTKT